MNSRKRLIINAVTSVIADEIEEATVEEESYSLIVANNFKKKRHKRVSIKGYVEQIVPNYGLDDFQSHFRMKKTTFEYVITLLGPHLKSNEGGIGRPSVNIEKKILVTLWMAANNCVYRDISDRFNIAKSTAWDYFHQVCKVLAKMAPQTIKWPTGREVQNIMIAFEKKRGFKNVIGAIDGTHIPIAKPEVNPSSYFNRKKVYSIQAQIVCDDKRRFIDFFAGYPGSVHDARVFKLSDLSRKMRNGELEFPHNSHLLGDSAYGNSVKLLVPYRDDGFLNEIKKNFNYVHSATRVIVEQAIGLWKGRFRMLSCVNIYNTGQIPEILLATAVLHNLCLDIGDDDIEIELDGNENAAAEIGEEGERVADQKRDTIAVQLYRM